MDPRKMYAYLELARGKVLDWVRPLSDEQYRRVFQIGLGSLARTLTHTMICEEMYVRRMLGREVPAYDQWPIRDEDPPAFGVLEGAWREQAVVTREGIGMVRDWDAALEYRVTWEGKPTIISASPSDIFTQLCFHEVHHRAQAMNMLRQLGVPAEDLDYNTLMYTRRPV